MFFAVALVAAQLVVADPAPAFAKGQAIGPLGAGEANAVVPGVVVRRSRKKKKDDTPSFNDVTVNVDKPTSEPNRGERGVFVRAVTSQPGVICRLKVRYRNDAEDSPDNTTADLGGVCAFHFDVPDKGSIVGDAQLIVTAFDLSGNVRGEGKRTINIRD